MSQLPMVSVITPCRNEERFIARCLDSILATEYPRDRLEIIVVDGCSEDATRRIVSEYASRDDAVRLLDNPRRITPAALNTAIRAARGDVIVRMDAHATYSPDYIPRLVAALEESGASMVGGLVDTVPCDSSALAAAIATATRHPFGVGNSRFRVGTTERQYVDHVPFFCCRRSLFDTVGMFDEELVRNQDGEFSFRVVCSGGKILLLPDVAARYFARRSLKQVGRMFYQYAYFKVLTTRKIGRVMTPRQLVPPLFLLSFVLTALLAPWWTPGAIAFAALTGAYGLALTISAVRAAGALGPRPAALLLAVFPVMHFSYGFGYIRRLYEFATRTNVPAEQSVLVPLSR